MTQGYFQRDWNFKLGHFHSASPMAIRMLRQVYMVLAFVFTSSTFGFCFRLAGMIGGPFAAIGVVVILPLYLIAPRMQGRRVFLMVTGAFFAGASLLPWFVRLPGMDSGTIITIQVGISLGFQCFWAATIWVRSLDYFYSSGVCLSIPVIWLWMIIASSELGSGHILVWMTQTYLVIILFMVCVAAYSHVLVPKLQRKDFDIPSHAITLFVDLAPFSLFFGKIVLRETLRKLREQELREQRRNSEPYI